MKISAQYVNQIWAKYPKSTRLELEKLVDGSGETGKEINKFETNSLVASWEKLKECTKTNNKA